MGGSSRERGAARSTGKPRSAGGRGSGDGPAVGEAWRSTGGSPAHSCGCNPWGGGSPRGEGRSPIIKHDAAVRTDSRADRSPEDGERRAPSNPRKRRTSLLAPPPRRVDAQPAGATSRGHADGDEPPGLRERHEPLKGEPQERHLSENGRTAGSGRSRREVGKT